MVPSVTKVSDGEKARQNFLSRKFFSLAGAAVVPVASLLRELASEVGSLKRRSGTAAAASTSGTLTREQAEELRREMSGSSSSQAASTSAAATCGEDDGAN